MARFQVSYVYRRVGNKSGGTQATKNVQATTGTMAVSIVKSELQAKGYEFILKSVKEI